jgi:hypothetical protein
VGWLLGNGLTSWLQLVWCLGGGLLGFPLSVGLAAVGCLCGGAAVWWNCRRPRVEFASPTEPSALAKVCRWLVIALFVNLLVQALLTPQRFWDERAIYGIKAAVLFEDRTILSPDLLEPDFVQYHPRYPLLIPLAEQHVYALLGKVDDRWPKLLFPLMDLGLVLAFAGILARHVGEARGWLFALLLACVPVLAPFELGFLSAQADAPVAAYHGVSVLYLWDWLQGRRAGHSGAAASNAVPIVLAGCLAGLTAFTKDEGIAFLLVNTVSLLLVTGCGLGRRGLRSAAMAGVYALSAAVVLVPWFWHRRVLPVTTEMSYFGRLGIDTLLAGGPAAAWSLRHLFSRMFLEAREWGLQWWGMAGSALLWPRRVFTPPQLFLLLDVLGGLAALVVAGMIAPTPVEEHVGGSAHRFLMQLAPVAVAFLAGQVGPPDGATSRRYDGQDATSSRRDALPPPLPR